MANCSAILSTGYLMKIGFVLEGSSTFNLMWYSSVGSVLESSCHQISNAHWNLMIVTSNDRVNWDWRDLPNFRHLFPLNSKSHDMKTRKSDFYKVSKSYSKRYLQSAIPSMQRLLNRDIKEQRESLKKLINCSVTSKLCLS